MSRRHRAVKRAIVPDIRYNSTLVAHLINLIMYGGKKGTAQRIVYGAFEKVSEKLQKGDPVDLMIGALENARPRLEVKSRRVGGATYQVPVEVRPARRMALAMRWTIDAARKRGETSMPRKLAGELIDAAESRGGAVKKREETHRMAEANKAFAHYRW